MKKYIRTMIDDLRRAKSKNFTPAVPKSTTEAGEINLNPAPEPALPRDLENQVLSLDPAERARQLDFQAQKNEEGEPLD